MLAVTINGQRGEFVEGTTILSACRVLGIELPTLCHDDRLKPCGACRLCIVHVNGAGHPVTACNTAISQGMEIETHTQELEDLRRTLLRLLADTYPADAVERCPDKEFHRWLRHYHVRRLTPSDGSQGLLTSSAPSHFQDSTHPYLHADLSKCIDCYRCVRICDELQGQFVWRAFNRGDRTRIGPANSPTLLGSECVSCGACADTCPTGAIEDQSVLRLGQPQRWTRTTCPYCGTGCEMAVGTSNGQIVQVKAVLDAPVSKGHLCVKGRYAFDFVHSGDRVSEPMIREDGEWRKVSWPEAINFVAGNFREILEQTGPDSIGVLGSARGTNEENYLAQKFARVVLGTNNVDCCARVCHAPTAAGMKQTFGTGAATNSFNDIERARTFLICGCNPTENHPIVGARIKQAVIQGAKLIVIDPREIELSRYAALHLQLRPGTNVPLLNAIAHVIVQENLTDEEAIRERVSEFKEFGESVRAWTPERAAAICGVDPELIRRAGRLYAKEKPSMCFHGLGVTEHIQGTEGVICLANLALLTGNFGKPGTGVNPLRGQNNVQGSAHMGCEPGNLTGYVSLDHGRDLFESIWQAPVPHSRGLNLMEMIDAAGAGKLRALWAIGYDVALTNPNACATKDALRKLDFVVVQDLFMNELARSFGHVFLPACSSFEKDGTFMNSERRVQRVRKAIEPLRKSKSDWEIICAIATAMGFKEQFNFRSPEEIWNEVRDLWKAGAGISYSRLEEGGLQWPCLDEQHPGTAILHTQSFPHGPRASLKSIEFNQTLEAPIGDYPFLLTTGRTLFQFNAGTMTMRTPNTQLRGTDTLDMAPLDAKRLGLNDGDRVRISSRHGEAFMPVRTDVRIKAGELFATFHAAEVFLNNLTSAYRDKFVSTPEYKVVAVNVQKA